MVPDVLFGDGNAEHEQRRTPNITNVVSGADDSGAALPPPIRVL
jgi:hypothetical protein